MKDLITTLIANFIALIILSILVALIGMVIILIYKFALTHTVIFFIIAIPICIACMYELIS